MKPLAVAGLAVLTIACADGDTAGRHVAPAHVEHPTTEDALTRITLTDAAVRRLGIETRPIEIAEARPVRTVGAEVVAAPGHTIVVSAPVAGRLLPLEGDRPPGVGARVRAGQPVFRMVALPTEDGLLSTREAVAVAGAQLQNARIKAERAERLYREEVGSLEAWQDARANLAAAEAAADAARARLELVGRGADDDVADLSTLAIRAPQDGTILRVLAGVGQTFAANTPLFEVVTMDPLWLRVPLYAGDLDTVDRSRAATVTALGGDPAAGRPVDPIEGPPTADRNAATVDLYYVVPNRDGRFRPGERVAVTLPLTGRESARLVPASALVRDVHGGSWVYESLGDRAFARRRVEVARTMAGNAVLSRGPEAGTAIVTIGAAELFGTEFGASH